MQQSAPFERVLASHRAAHLQVILVGGKQSASIKARNGLTPPMRDAARRMFDQSATVDQKLMQKLEDDLLAIAQVLHAAISALGLSSLDQTAAVA